MPFQKGHSYGGAKPGAGRKPKKELEIKQAAAVIAREFIEENIKPVLSNYLRLAQGDDGATTRHFVDKVLPDEKFNPQGTVINVQFVQFNNNQHSPQLQAKNISTAVLAIDANQEAGLSGVASAQRQGQGGIEFHSFEDVS